MRLDGQTEVHAEEQPDNRGLARPNSQAERPPNGQLAGKAALVTGAGTGIGQGVAVELARRGAKVAVHYNNSEAGALETIRRIKQFGGKSAVFLQALNPLRAPPLQMIDNRGLIPLNGATPERDNRRFCRNLTFTAAFRIMKKPGRPGFRQNGKRSCRSCVPALGLRFGSLDFTRPGTCRCRRRTKSRSPYGRTLEP
ncbi:SDR family NAD(P)-dependent oxidoreductase [Cohnella laeviribosi]|uniref:SDR family NAD(P)-dependent oxidoreductase n=1 Tax=Cohnella laeviribosi TaxID=380174 RepID=UPI000A038D84|nr:SDR family NAD(P)-dependent oxidoreductase [Cohnella laeviribosi]